MARRPNQHFVSQVEQEITYRAMPNGIRRIGREGGSALMRIAKFVDGVEEQNNYPIVGSEEKLTFGVFGAKATFTVFVRDGFDKDNYRSFDMGVIGEDGFEHFVPNTKDARFYIGETEVFYDWNDRSWSRVDSDHSLDDFYYDDGYADLYDYAD